MVAHLIEAFGPDLTVYFPQTRRERSNPFRGAPQPPSWPVILAPISQFRCRYEGAWIWERGGVMKSYGLCAVARPLFPSPLSTAHPSPRRAPTLSHPAPASSLKFLHTRKKCEGGEGRGLARGARGGAGGRRRGFARPLGAGEWPRGVRAASYAGKKCREGKSVTFLRGT